MKTHVTFPIIKVIRKVTYGTVPYGSRHLTEFNISIIFFKVLAENMLSTFFSILLSFLMIWELIYNNLKIIQKPEGFRIYYDPFAILFTDTFAVKYAFTESLSQKDSFKIYIYITLYSTHILIIFYCIFISFDPVCQIHRTYRTYEYFSGLFICS